MAEFLNPDCPVCGAEMREIEATKTDYDGRDYPDTVGFQCEECNLYFDLNGKEIEK